MSETGAKVPSRDDLVMGAFEECSGPYIGIAPDEILKLTTYTEAVVDYLLFVLRRQIVPAGAVVLTAEEAEDAEWACEVEALSLANYGDALENDGYEDKQAIENQRIKERRYRALAAKLGTEAADAKHS